MTGTAGQWVDSASRTRTPSPAAPSLTLSRLGQRRDPTVSDTVRVARWVKRRFNRHACEGPGCEDARHARDVEDCRTVLEALGFRDTARRIPTRAPETWSAKKPQHRGRCPACGRRVALKTTGLVGKHPAGVGADTPHCDGVDHEPVREAS